MLVLWCFIFLFVAAFDFTSSVREEGMAAHRFANEAQGYYLAVAGFEEGVYRFLAEQSGGSRPDASTDGPAQTGEIADGSWHEGVLGEGFYRFRLVDEGSKVNINHADERLLRRVFTNLGVEGSRIDILVDSILDWRDQDDLHRLNGAEDDYYLSLSPGYTAKNGLFDTVEELLWVKGVTPEFFYGIGGDGSPGVGLREIFTVDSRASRVNLRTVSAEVCHALLGIPMEECQKFVQERKKLSEKGLVDLLELLGLGSGEARANGLVFVAPTVLTIEASGYRDRSAAPVSVRGVVRFVRGGRGFKLVRWVDEDAGNPYVRRG